MPDPVASCPLRLGGHSGLFCFFSPFATAADPAPRPIDALLRLVPPDVAVVVTIEGLRDQTQRVSQIPSGGRPPPAAGGTGLARLGKTPTVSAGARSHRDAAGREPDGRARRASWATPLFSRCGFHPRPPIRQARPGGFFSSKRAILAPQSLDSHGQFNPAGQRRARRSCRAKPKWHDLPRPRIPRRGPTATGMVRRLSRWHVRLFQLGSDDPVRD